MILKFKTLAALGMLASTLLHGADHRGSQFLGWTEFESWRLDPGQTSGSSVTLSREIQPDIAWDELVPSWNVDLPAETGLALEARAWIGERPTRFYHLGHWSEDGKSPPRESVKGQNDDHGEVQTDTLVLKHPARRLELRVTLLGKAPSVASLRFVGVSLLDRSARPPTLPPNPTAWGRVLEVPERSQANYPGGAQSWCSPTCVSMVLAYWARQLQRPELDHDVPAVVSGVYDPNWSGTGNWPFNTAFAGSFPGLRAYVTRFTDVSELEDWLAAGLPVVVSVSYELLQGRPRTRESGHLVVCVGFDQQGNIVVNDPGTRLNVRKTFARDNLVRAWAESHNTVYLIYPLGRTPPKDRFGHWHSP